MPEKTALSPGRTLSTWSLRRITSNVRGRLPAGTCPKTNAVNEQASFDNLLEAMFDLVPFNRLMGLVLPSKQAVWCLTAPRAHLVRVFLYFCLLPIDKMALLQDKFPLLPEPKEQDD